ncbi:MAG: IPT/TIG domain-containing protein [Myxococcaceae bacterium]|nr:IPT/TIG domain-containing protein [Myxococcaceae bacterium]
MKRFLLLLLVAVPLWACPDGGGNTQNDGGGTDGGDGGEQLPGAADGGGLPDGGDGGLPELKLTAVLPPRGVTAGGTQVTLTGSGFLAGFAETASDANHATSIRFGTNPAQDFQVVDDGIIDVRAPPGVPGTVDVTLTNGRGTVVCTGCFTYFAELSLRGIAPDQGPDTGGNEVVLTGTGLTSQVTVLFGPRRSPKATAEPSGNTLRAVAPAATVGERVDVLVYGPNGMGLLRRAYLYQPRLTVADVSPRTEQVGNPVEVTLTGSGLGTATAVSFGSAVGVLSAVSDNALTVQVPASVVPGAVDITVTGPGQEWRVLRGFTWWEAAGGPALFAAYPRLLPPGGGPVTLTGQGLAAATAVRIGGVPIPIAARAQDAIDVNVPPDATFTSSVLEAQVDVPGQTLVLPAAVTFRVALQPPPMTPTDGPHAGGTPAALTGTHLPQDARVLMGVVDATAVDVLPDTKGTQATFLTPLGSSGSGVQDVWVRSAADPENEAVLPDAFTYALAPASIGRVQPDRGAIPGGTLVTVLGDGFGAEGMVVDFGQWRAKDVKVLDVHTLTCRIPKAEVGTVDVAVQRRDTDGTRTGGTLPGGFSFFDPRNLSGGLSGGPLSGTFNVTVLDGTQERYGTPIDLAGVMLGTDPTTPFQGLTDFRGQLTFSDPALVKAQTVTVWKDGYQSVTVTSVNAQNLTVLVTPTGGSGNPSDPPPPPPASIIMGKVTGFKAPRPLLATERLQARVFVAQQSLFQGPPFAVPSMRQGETWVLSEEGQEYLVASGAGTKAVYAILGIVDSAAQTFSPHLMGVRRGVPAQADIPARGQDIVLDTHLDVVTPMLLQGPLLAPGGGTAASELYAWLDVGSEGFIPHPLNWGAGTTTNSSVVTAGTTVDFPRFPLLDAANFIFMGVGFSGSNFSVTFRRQHGALADGVDMPPMLQVPTFLEPTATAGLSAGLIRWSTPPGPTPDIHQVDILLPTLTGAVSLWSFVLPGNETQVSLPAHVVNKLRVDAEGATLFVSIMSSRSPRFRYDQWSYTETLSPYSWTSFVQAMSEGFIP